MFGPTLGLSSWLQDLSPFTHTPKVPAASLSVPPLLVLALVATAVAVAGFVAIRRRALVLPA
jgi:ABC-2 type transport system permease protein